MGTDNPPVPGDNLALFIDVFKRENLTSDEKLHDALLKVATLPQRQHDLFFRTVLSDPSFAAKSTLELILVGESVSSMCTSPSGIQLTLTSFQPRSAVMSFGRRSTTLPQAMKSFLLPFSL